MEAGFRCCIVDHLMLIQQGISGCVIVAIYINDILLTGSDTDGIAKTKKYLRKHFVTKDIGRPRYFFGIEFAYNRDKVLLSQKKVYP